MINLIPTRRIMPLIMAVLGALLLAVVIFIYGVYARQWYNPTVKIVLAALPLPAASVSYQPLPISQYRELTDTIRQYSSVWQQVAGTQIDSDAFHPEVIALNKMIRDQATFTLLRQRRISLTETDVDQAFSAQMAQVGDSQQTTATIREIYGWTPAQFKENILKVAVAREKLREALSFDSAVNTTQQQQADRVYQLVQNSDQSFAELAKSYSEDQYAANGGDMGYIKSGEQLTEIDDAAFSLKVGETSDLIHTKYGWHILSVENEQTVDGVREVQVRQIFIAAPSVDQAITNYLQAKRVMVFVPGLAWDQAEVTITVK